MKVTPILFSTIVYLSAASEQSGKIRGSISAAADNNERVAVADAKDIGYPVTFTSANQGEMKMKTFEQQVSVAQGNNTRASGHAESRSETELPECITLGFSGSAEGCTTYCTDHNFDYSGYGQIGKENTITCSCHNVTTGIRTNVCTRSPPGPNTEGKPCTDFGIASPKTCTDYCNHDAPGGWSTTFNKGGKVVNFSCTCISIGCVTTEPFSCTASSSSALSLLLPGVVVTVTTYLITMVI